MALISTRERPYEVCRNQPAGRLRCPDLAADGGGVARHDGPAQDRGPNRLAGPRLASGAVRVRGVHHRAVLTCPRHFTLSSPCPIKKPKCPMLKPNRSARMVIFTSSAPPSQQSAIWPKRRSEPSRF